MGAGFKAAIVVVFTVAVVIGVLVGKAQKTQSAGANFPTAPATIAPTPQPGHVAAIDNASGSAPARFIPSVLKAHVGEKVTWVNESSVVVGVVADNGAFDSEALSPGQKFAWTPTKPGGTCMPRSTIRTSPALSSSRPDRRCEHAGTSRHSRIRARGEFPVVCAARSEFAWFVRLGESNRPDGTVEAVVEGADEDVRRFISWAHRGPSAAQVDSVDVQFQQPEGLSVLPSSSKPCRVETYSYREGASIMSPLQRGHSLETTGGDTVLFGRMKHSAAIARCLSVARGGRMQVMLLSGDPGVGKTSLMEHAAADASSRGARVLRGGASDTGGNAALSTVS